MRESGGFDSVVSKQEEFEIQIKKQIVPLKPSKKVVVQSPISLRTTAAKNDLG